MKKLFALICSFLFLFIFCLPVNSSAKESSLNGSAFLGNDVQPMITIWQKAVQASLNGITMPGSDTQPALDCIFSAEIQGVVPQLLCIDRKMKKIFEEVWHKAKPAIDVFHQKMKPVLFISVSTLEGSIAKMKSVIVQYMDTFIHNKMVPVVICEIGVEDTLMGKVHRLITVFHNKLPVFIHGQAKMVPVVCVLI